MPLDAGMPVRPQASLVVLDLFPAQQVAGSGRAVSRRDGLGSYSGCGVQVEELFGDDQYEPDVVEERPPCRRAVSCLRVPWPEMPPPEMLHDVVSDEPQDPDDVW